MSVDTTARGTRRALLVGAAGGMAAVAAHTISRPEAVRAGPAPTPVYRDQDNPTTGVTSITRSTAGVAFSATGGNGVFGIAPPGAGSMGVGVAGQSDPGTGVSGSSNAGAGVVGSSASAAGVSGGSDTSWGMTCQSRTNNKAGLRAESYGGIGVLGYSFPEGGPFPPASIPRKTGVYGRAVQDADARGVTGESTAGRGVSGIATSGTGVHGTATNGEGMRGVSTSSNGVAGTTASGVASGVYGENTGGGYGAYGRSNTLGGIGTFGEAASGIGMEGNSHSGTGIRAVTVTGVAFEAQGPVSFSTAGLSSVAVGQMSKTITPATDLKPSSLVLCTLESNQAGLFIQRVTKNTTLDTFKVFLSAAVGSGKTARIGWFVIG